MGDFPIPWARKTLPDEAIGNERTRVKHAPEPYTPGTTLLLEYSRDASGAAHPTL